MKKYRSEKSGQAILETYDRILSTWQCETKERDYDRILSTWQCETKERDVETEYGTTHVIECGAEEGPALVLFHGVGDDSALMWIYNAPELGKHFHLYAIDTMGGPGKSVPNENYNKEFDDVRWIDGVLDALGIGKAFFAGVSMGGYHHQHFRHCTGRRKEELHGGDDEDLPAGGAVSDG